MAQRFSTISPQRKYCSCAARRGLVLFISFLIALLLTWIQAGSPAFSAGKEAQAQAGVGGSVQADQEVRQIEPGKAIERELAGGQSHSYQITLAAGQYLNLLIEQRGIDVVVKVFGLDGKQITEFDSEIRAQGQEIVSLVAEEAGSYRLNVVATQKDVPAGRYVIREIVLRDATEKDRALEKARRLDTEFLRLHSLGKYDEAHTPALRALEIREKAREPYHPDIAESLNNLALIYFYKGDYAQAEPLYQRALSIMEKGSEPNHLNVAILLDNLALIYLDKGDYAKAESFFLRALSIKEKSLESYHPQVARSLGFLANTYNLKGDYIKAKQVFQRLLSLAEKKLGTAHPGIAQVRTLITKIYEDLDINYFLELEPVILRGLSSKEKELGLNHPEIALSLYSLALIYFYKGDYAKAEPLFLRTLSIWEKAHGAGHHFVASSLTALALLYRARGEIKQAATLQTRANEISERNLNRNLIAGSERQKLAYLALFATETNATLSLHNLSAPNEPQALNLAFTTLLRRKGRGLDAMTDTMAALRRNASPQTQSLIDQLVAVRSQLSALTLKEPGSAKPGAFQSRIKPLEEQAEKLEAELNTLSYEFRAQSQPVTLAAVQAALPNDCALVEFVVYTPQEPQPWKSKPARYLAYVLAAQGEPKWVDLGEAAPIDRAIDAWRNTLVSEKDKNGILKFKDAKPLARELDELVMRPVRGLTGKTQRLLISPDGLLNLIPFAALVDESGEYLVSKYLISYLTSGRDLMRLQISQQSKSDTLVVAEPVFGRIDPARISFQPLPATRDEAMEIKKMLPKASVLLREQATEAALKQAKAPRILHVATHGFFISDQKEALPAGTRGIFGEDLLRRSDLQLSNWAAKIKDPLLRSGLALAGANQGKSGDDDGLLTALEAAGLDLWGTKLVVLSACDTGVGEVRNGEGVQGLRRALVLAGSESQVMTLWPVSDVATRDLMIPYYRALRQGEGRGEALRQIQLQMLRSKDRRHPFYWAAFIQSGEWANLEGKR